MNHFNMHTDSFLLNYAAALKLQTGDLLMHKDTKAIAQVRCDIDGHISLRIGDGTIHVQHLGEFKWDNYFPIDHTLRCLQPMAPFIMDAKIDLLRKEGPLTPYEAKLIREGDVLECLITGVRSVVNKTVEGGLCIWSTEYQTMQRVAEAPHGQHWKSGEWKPVLKTHNRLRGGKRLRPGWTVEEKLSGALTVTEAMELRTKDRVQTWIGDKTYPVFRSDAGSIHIGYGAETQLHYHWSNPPADVGNFVPIGDTKIRLRKPKDDLGLTPAEVLKLGSGDWVRDREGNRYYVTRLDVGEIRIGDGSNRRMAFHREHPPHEIWDFIPVGDTAERLRPTLFFPMCRKVFPAFIMNETAVPEATMPIYYEALDKTDLKKAFEDMAKRSWNHNAAFWQWDDDLKVEEMFMGIDMAKPGADTTVILAHYWSKLFTEAEVKQLRVGDQIQFKDGDVVYTITKVFEDNALYARHDDVMCGWIGRKELVGRYKPFGDTAARLRPFAQAKGLVMVQPFDPEIKGYVTEQPEWHRRTSLKSQAAKFLNCSDFTDWVKTSRHPSGRETMVLTPDEVMRLAHGDEIMLYKDGQDHPGQHFDVWYHHSTLYLWDDKGPAYMVRDEDGLAPGLWAWHKSVPIKATLERLRPTFYHFQAEAYRKIMGVTMDEIIRHEVYRERERRQINAEARAHEIDAEVSAIMDVCRAERMEIAMPSPKAEGIPSRRLDTVGDILLRRSLTLADSMTLREGDRIYFREGNHRTYLVTSLDHGSIRLDVVPTYGLTGVKPITITGEGFSKFDWSKWIALDHTWTRIEGAQ